MTTQEIVALQTRVGTEPDGFWGPMSMAATQAHLRALMPDPIPWPKQDEVSLRGFYGPAGDESRLVWIDFPFPMYYGTKAVSRHRVHEKCAESLLRVLREIYVLHSGDDRIMKHAENFDGIFNDRAMRGGTRKSLHARGAAIDLSAETNGNSTHWPTQATMPLEIMEAFSREGWLSAGAFWSRDAMHFQATR